MSVRLWVKPALLDGTELVLGGEDFHYLARVHRLAAGDDLTLFDGAGRQATARVLSVDGRHDAITLRRGDIEASALVRATAFTLIVALLKADKMDLVVQKATELGVAAIWPVACERSIVKLEPRRAEERVERWKKIAVEAARQSGRASVPEVLTPRPLAQALAEADARAPRLVFDERAESALAGALPAGGEPLDALVLATGPEGGFTRAEIAEARERGFAVVGLGPRVLRAETAAIAALAVLGWAVGDLRETGAIRTNG
jgi:16S rRNA (uracil1498-N3)-methyltransferase